MLALTLPSWCCRLDHNSLLKTPWQPLGDNLKAKDYTEMMQDPVK